MRGDNTKQDRPHLGRLSRMATAGAFGAALALAAVTPATAADGGGNQAPAVPKTNSLATAYASIFGSAPKNRMGIIWADTKLDMQCWAEGAWSKRHQPLVLRQCSQTDCLRHPARCDMWA
ncbi:hypothetical protein ACFWP3_02460 [Streptomyces sp. NPDC058525]|uniref:hypothetical protein n=1 Tax=Streptomyces sp. NPDC058525 TaxID=3346538 RepID=UPI0036511830